jgi:hypothetical protein
MYIKTLISVFLWLTINQAHATVLHSVGVARDAKDNALRYIEHHQYLSDGKHLVRYYDENMDLVAFKELLYPGLPQHPLIVQADLQSRTEIRTSIQNDRLTMVRTDHSGVQNIELQLTADVIIDAGFDAFIQNDWDNLLSRKEQSLRFAIAGQPRLLDVALVAIPGGESGVDFHIKPESWIVRLFLPKIELKYNEARQLISYEGFSNLKSSNGKNGKVHISFTHHRLSEELLLPLAEWLPAQ